MCQSVIANDRQAPAREGVGEGRKGGLGYLGGSGGAGEGSGAGKGGVGGGVGGGRRTRYAVLLPNIPLKPLPPNMLRSVSSSRPNSARIAFAESDSSSG